MRSVSDSLVPLIDTVFALVAVLMISFPALYKRLDIKVGSAPEGDALGQSAESIQPVVVSVDKDGFFYISNEKVGDRAEFVSKLAELISQKAGILAATVYVEADENSSYGDIIFAITTAKDLGFKKVIMVT